jgi:mannitol/fructose-specific phosphotransferase system IIA component (Ntr-type)/NhaP-type Na+/H+ or K+/H+ antiporter
VNVDQPLLSLAAVLICGIIGGELFALLRLPKVTGWIGTGIVLRAASLPGLSPEQLQHFGPLMNFVLGFIAFTVGAALNVRSLRNAHKRLLFLVLGEALVTPLVVGAALYFIGGLSLGMAGLLAAVAIAGAPGTTVLVVQEARARGILSKTLVAAVGLIDMVAVGVFVVAAVYAGGTGQDDTWQIAAQAAAVQFGWALAIGAGVAVSVLLLTRTIVSAAFLGPAMVAAILGSWGLAQSLGISSILACTFAGMAVSNIRHATANAAEAYLKPLGGLLFAGFYTLAGMRLDFSVVVPVAGLVVLFFVSRLAGKSLGAFLAMKAAGATELVQRHLGLALLPHGGVAVGLLLLVQSDPALAEVQETVVAVGLAALAINQLLGPSATRFSLGRAGEVGKDRPRLLDFLTEQRIVTGLSVATKAELITKLADHLYATTDLPIEKEEFVRRILAREDEASTCLGEGFMIPHAILPEGERIQGVLGLSTKGLDLGASDGHDVHAVVLLATPDVDRQRHLEILSAFASAITRNASLREQLYHARSPAHAYDVLHADRSEELNYFLDEAIQDTEVESRAAPEVAPHSRSSES